MQPIILRTRHILIENDGELHIGSEMCPYQGNVVISLYGRYVCMIKYYLRTFQYLSSTTEKKMFLKITFAQKYLSCMFCKKFTGFLDNLNVL